MTSNEHNMTTVDFLMNSPMRTVFVKSVDTFAYMKTRETIYELLHSFDLEIGEPNVVQLVTGN
jgi:hypothetical protein